MPNFLLCAEYPDVRVVAVIEPDSLANLVTNMNVAKCSNAATAYKVITPLNSTQLRLTRCPLRLVSHTP